MLAPETKPLILGSDEHAPFADESRCGGASAGDAGDCRSALWPERKASTQAVSVDAEASAGKISRPALADRGVRGCAHPVAQQGSDPLRPHSGLLVRRRRQVALDIVAGGKSWLLAR